MSLSAFWMMSSNVGDNITPYILKKVTGKDPVYAQGGADYEHYVFAGSILNHANAKSMVWGAGIATWTDSISVGARLMAVRGPISRNRAVSLGIRCPHIYGDPGILLPKFYFPHVEKTHDVGIVPHYTDQFRADAWYPEGRIINVLQPVEDFVREILSCRKIVSSSLHGIIIAHAYGIPATWVRISDSIGGDGTKYVDYYGSVNMDITEPVDLRDKHDLPSVPDTLPDLQLMRDRLWNACPIPVTMRRPEYL